MRSWNRVSLPRNEVRSQPDYEAENCFAELPYWLGAALPSASQLSDRAVLVIALSSTTLGQNQLRPTSGVLKGRRTHTFSLCAPVRQRASSIPKVIFSPEFHQPLVSKEVFYYVMESNSEIRDTGHVFTPQRLMTINLQTVSHLPTEKLDNYGKRSR